MKENEQLVSELETVRGRNGGILRAEDVVEFARNDRTALHGQFQWDDSEAAAQYRLEQARKVIRMTLTILPGIGSDRPQPMYVSLLDDRTQPKGGYRPFSEVISDDQQRQQLLRQALGEMRTFRRKYEALRALRPLFRAIDKVEERAKPVVA